jgi:outer membrane protein OmpA-like peptidoglycan-associated protein
VVLNYKEQIGKLAATILFESKTEISAKLSKDGVETWMHVSCDGGFATNYTVVVVEKAPLKLTLTAPAADDYRLLGHMPGYTVATSDKKSFDEFEFPMGADVATSKVQGKLFQFALAPTGRKEPPGDVEVIENYAAAIKAKGGEVLVQSNTDLTGRMEDNGQQVWVKLRSLFGAVDLVVVEEKAFKATIEPPKAEAMKSALEKDGRMALQVNFEFAKSTLKPDAAPIIAQVVALLTANADYKITIEGHTDNVGRAEANQKLSESRAEAVVEALVKGGIAKDRLAAAGFGATQPVASNDTGEGRAKNRRVELVKK